MTIIHTLVCTTVLISTLASAGTLNPAMYPVMDKLPPANASWSAAILKNIPNLPVNQKGLPNPDWSKDVTNCPKANQWGLSYDDGPGPYTADLLSALKARNQLATFFIIGSRAIEYPAQLLQTYQAGHQIGIHTWSHPQATTVSSEQYVAEIVFTAQAIKEIIGVTPRFFRPPYGDIDDRIRAILQNLGLTIVEWSLDSKDADGALDVVQQFQKAANAGSGPVISLEHDLFATSEPQAAPALDAILAGSGKYVPMPIDKCLGYAAYDEGFWDRVAGKGLPPVNPLPVSTASAAATSHSTSQALPTGLVNKNPASSSTGSVAKSGSIASQISFGVSAIAIAVGLVFV
ncbi:chitin deacetylase [Batrachochytrium dendrobatidis]